MREGSGAPKRAGAQTHLPLRLVALAHLAYWKDCPIASVAHVALLSRTCVLGGVAVDIAASEGPRTWVGRSVDRSHCVALGEQNA